MNYNKLIERIDRNVPVDFGDIFGESFSLGGKVIGEGILLVVMQVLFAIPFIIIMYIPLLSIGLLDNIFDGGYYGYDDYGSYSSNFEGLGVLAVIIMVIVMIIMILFIQVATLALNAGFYRICKEKDLNGSANVGDLFSFFKGKYLGKLLVLSLATFGISLIATLLCVLPLFYVMVPIYLMTVIFAFNPELSVSQIINASFRLGNKKWLVLFGLIMIFSIFIQIGAYITCGLIALFSFFLYLPLYITYKKTVGFDSETPEVVEA